MSITKDTTKVKTRSKLTGTLEERRAQFNARIHKWYPNLEILSPYMNATTKIKFYCKRCGSTFGRLPYDMGQISTRTRYGCKTCNIQARTQDKTMPLSMALKRLHKLFPDIQYISGYKGYHAKAHFKCLKCNKEFDRAWDRFAVSKDGCPYCIHNHWGSNRRKDPKEYQKEFDAKFPNLTLLTPYISGKRNVTVKCNKCGNVWNVQPLELLLHKYGCNICANRHTGFVSRKTLKDFWLDLKKVNPNVYIKSKYSGNKVPIKAQCKICSYNWSARPNDLLTSRSRCPQCGFAQNTYKRASFCKAYRKIRDKRPDESYQHYNQHAFAYVAMKKHPHIRLLSIFQTYDGFVRIKCLKCGNTNYLTAKNLLNGFACPRCERIGLRVSRGERVIVSLLSQAGIHFEYPFIPRELTDKISLHYDFRVNGKYLIEYQGEQHYRPVDYFGGEEQFKVQQQHDQMKREWAKENGFELIEISFMDSIKEKLGKYFPKVLAYEPEINYEPLKHIKKLNSSLHLGKDLFDKFNVVRNGLSLSAVIEKSLCDVQVQNLKLVHYKYARMDSHKDIRMKGFTLSGKTLELFNQYRDQFESISDEIRALLYTYYLEQTKT